MEQVIYELGDRVKIVNKTSPLFDRTGTVVSIIYKKRNHEVYDIGIDVHDEHYRINLTYFQVEDLQKLRH